MSKTAYSPQETPDVNIERIDAAPDRGLTTEEVALRVKAGYANTPVEPPTKTTKQIILSNLLTYFNLIFFILAMSVILVGRFRELGFTAS